MSAQAAAMRCRVGTRHAWLWPLFLIALPLMMLSGCASLLPKLQPPQLTVTGIVLGGGNLQQQQLQVRLHASNPNERAIAIRGIECHLDLSGRPFAQGTTDAAFTLPALGETDFTLDVTADIGAAMTALAGSLGHSSVDYRLYGQVHLASGIVRTVPFSQNGRVRL
jgi:LEA14-like dessication related protein